jgi:hypothetical protein
MSNMKKNLRKKSRKSLRKLMMRTMMRTKTTRITHMMKVQSSQRAGETDSSREHPSSKSMGLHP